MVVDVGVVVDVVIGVVAGEVVEGVAGVVVGELAGATHPPSSKVSMVTSMNPAISLVFIILSPFYIFILCNGITPRWLAGFIRN